jgi:hypothetical protein
MMACMAIAVVTDEYSFIFDPLFSMDDGSKEPSHHSESSYLKELKNSIFIVIDNIEMKY